MQEEGKSRWVPRVLKQFSNRDQCCCLIRRCLLGDDDMGKNIRHSSWWIGLHYIEVNWLGWLQNVGPTLQYLTRPQGRVGRQQDVTVMVTTRHHLRLKVPSGNFGLTSIWLASVVLCTVRQPLQHCVEICKVSDLDGGPLDRLVLASTCRCKRLGDSEPWGTGRRRWDALTGTCCWSGKRFVPGPLHQCSCIIHDVCFFCHGGVVWLDKHGIIGAGLCRCLEPMVPYIEQ